MIPVRQASGKYVKLADGKYLSASRSVTAQFADVSTRANCLYSPTVMGGGRECAHHYRVDCLSINSRTFTLTSNPNVSNSPTYSCLLLTTDSGLPLSIARWYSSNTSSDDPTCTDNTDEHWACGGIFDCEYKSARDVLVFRAYQEALINPVGVTSSFTIRTLVFYAEIALCDIPADYPAITLTNVLDGSEGDTYTDPDGTLYDVCAINGTVTLTFSCDAADASDDATCGCCGRPACFYTFTCRVERATGNVTSGPSQVSASCDPGLAQYQGHWFNVGGAPEGYCDLRYIIGSGCCAEHPDCDTWPATPAAPSAAVIAALCGNCDSFFPASFSITLSNNVSICNGLANKLNVGGNFTLTGDPSADTYVPVGWKVQTYSAGDCTGTLLSEEDIVYVYFPTWSVVCNYDGTTTITVEVYAKTSGLAYPIFRGNVTIEEDGTCCCYATSYTIEQDASLVSGQIAGNGKMTVEILDCPA